MDRGKSRCLRASKRRPLPIMSSLRAPDSGPLTFRSEISQGTARRHVGNLCLDHKEKSARLAKWRDLSGLFLVRLDRRGLVLAGLGELQRLEEAVGGILARLVVADRHQQPEQPVLGDV